MKIALVTGASSGLGRAFVELIDKKHFVDEIWGIGRCERSLQQIRICTNFRPIVCDITKIQDIKKLDQILQMEKPEIKILINSAGAGKFGLWKNISLQDSINMIDLNCRGTVLVTQISIPFMVRGGHILEICSTAAFQPLSYFNIYAATKSFLYSYSCALHKELSCNNISVTAVCPYWISDTNFINEAKKNGDKNCIKNFRFALNTKTVASKALRDAMQMKIVSTPGVISSWQYILSRVVPDKIIMKFWDWFRKL
ncbi:SDR family NAD(P)-dependent oxidoreductase [Pectinatus haikarae]|uniref:SDR family NAD(P)-dependent oxidoreductase n=1 Tax=Pectinatus haikarae TaxID=349096 RepID=UPI0018C5C67E|nr:SDR family NAD(P)-dependent oxidoreductase [Pectinatus haikarae]